MIFPGKSQQGGNNVKSGQLSRAGAMHMASDQLRPGAILDSTRAASWLIVYMASARLAWVLGVGCGLWVITFAPNHPVSGSIVGAGLGARGPPQVTIRGGAGTRGDLS